MIPVGAPPRVHALLRASPDGRVPVVHAGRDAVYLEVGGRCVGVVGQHAVAVPCALRSGVEEFQVSRAELRGGVLHLDGAPLVVGRLVDVAVPRIRVTALGPAPSLGDVAAMLGRGDGLTPYEDDVLCGWLALHRAAGVATTEVDGAVRAALHRTTLLSATLLECAMHGEVLPEFAAWVAARGTPAEPGRAAALAAVGHSSGRGLLHGARLALSGLEAREGAA